MTTTRRDIRSRARLALSVMTGSALLAAGAAVAPVLTTSANAASPASTTSHQRQEADPRVVHHDARRDVLLFHYDPETSRPVPRDRASDIVTTVVDHRAARLVVQSRVRELSRTGYRLMVGEIVTSQGKRFELVVDFSNEPIASRVTLRPFNSGNDVPCPGATWSLDRSADRIGASVPRSCLGNPRWVRVGLAIVSSPRSLEESRADDSRAKGQVADEHLRLGPRQPRA